MADGLLSQADTEEALSVAYAQAIAAGAGYVISKADFDRDGIDLTFEAGAEMRPKIGAQLKATINLGPEKGGLFRFPCKAPNYNALVIATQTPRILVVLDLPEAVDDWLSVDRDGLVLRRCAYWVVLRGQTATENKSSVTIEIPSSNLLDVVALKNLMAKSRAGLLS